MDDDLQARLDSHAQSFEGLLSLIPAKDYYAQDNSDQWQRKKQTKEEKRAARRAKLDPANQLSAMDVINQNEKKRKRELGIESDNEVEAELPTATDRPNKKAKKESNARAAQPIPAGDERSKADKRKEKRERQKEKAVKQKEKAEAKRAKKEAAKSEQIELAAEGDEVQDDDAEAASEVDGMDFSGLVDEANSTASSSPDMQIAVFDVSSANQSTASSASSITPVSEIAERVPNISKPEGGRKEMVAKVQPSAKAANGDKQSTSKLSAADQEKLHARLRARIEELRAKRKADGPDGQPVRSRQQLLEARRQKSEARKKHKKELRAKAKAEEDRINQERLQGSGSPLSADIFSPRSPMVEHNNFSFGRVAFDDGTAADAGLTDLLDPATKKKRSRDVKGALEVAKKKEDRMKGFDDEKRRDIEDKARWLNAKKRAHGERVRDDTSLLKKALKRKEKQKSKSEKAWNEREEGIKKGKEMRQKKREENLAKRKEEKGNKGKKTKGKPVKKKRRPGFEGK